MNLKNKTLSCFVLASILVSLILYVVFLTIDFSNVKAVDTTYIKYSIVIISSLISILGIFLYKEKRIIVKQVIRSLAFLLTLISDYFLLIKMDNFILGVSFFIGAQICHFASISIEFKASKKVLLIFGGAFILSISTGLGVLFAIKQFNALYAVVIVYVVILLSNFILSFLNFIFYKDYIYKGKAIFLTIGFLLFIGCDICVGLYNLGHYEIYNFIWLFYAPSQILISISSFFPIALNKKTMQ